jgi:hypothetical protein
MIIHIHGNLNYSDSPSHICQQGYSHLSIYFKLFNTLTAYPRPNRKLQKLFRPTQHHPQKLKNIIVSRIALAALFYPSADQIEEIGD